MVKKGGKEGNKRRKERKGRRKGVYSQRKQKRGLGKEGRKGRGRENSAEERRE